MKSAEERIKELDNNWSWDIDLILREDVLKIIDVITLSLLTRLECREEITKRDIEEIVGKPEDNPEHTVYEEKVKV